MFDLKLQKLIETALDEDVGTGDITTLSTIPADREASGRFIAKQDGIVCGIDVCRAVFDFVDHAVNFKANMKDGEKAVKGDIIAEVSGNARSLLTAERTGLNLMQRMSGIATSTAKAVEAVKGYSVKICDTRKTTPGLRTLEKYAVKCGGGSNHRFNLADGVLIKDNHIAAAGSITAAVTAARNNIPHTLKIEVEVENFDELREALDCGADIIMLDNMTVPDMTEAVKLVAGRAITEASGNMGERNLAEVAATGVDLISIGALTHSVIGMDISLKLKLA